MFLSQTEDQEMICIGKLKNVSSSHDKVHSKLIKTVAQNIVHPLAHVIDLFVMYGVISTSLRRIKVCHNYSLKPR